MEDYGIFKAEQFMKADDEVTVLRFASSDQCGQHAHDFIEFAYIDRGRGYHIINGEPMPLQKGDFFIINAHVPHAYTPEEGTEIVIYNCIFQPESIGLSPEESRDFVDVAYRYLLHTFYAEKSQQSYIKISGAKSKKIKRLLEDMYEEYCQREKGFKQILRFDLTKLLILAFRLYKSDESQLQNPPMLKQLVAENALRYMKLHYAEEITCELLAERAYLSVSYFNKVFKESTGRTVRHALQNIRMEEACRILRETNLPITQVALHVGYADTKNFYRLFRQTVGQTPGEYRQNRDRLL